MWGFSAASATRNYTERSVDHTTTKKAFSECHNRVRRLFLSLLLRIGHPVSSHSLPTTWRIYKQWFKESISVQKVDKRYTTFSQEQNHLPKEICYWNKWAFWNKRASFCFGLTKWEWGWGIAKPCKITWNFILVVYFYQSIMCTYRTTAIFVYSSLPRHRFTLGELNIQEGWTRLLHELYRTLLQSHFPGFFLLPQSW